MGERLRGYLQRHRRRGRCNAEGSDRLSYSTSYALVRRLAKRGGIASAGKISPHSLGAGVPLQDVQDAMGHADPRTTRAYAAANADQADVDGDGAGDACDAINDRDLDADGVNDDVDNC